MSTASEMMHMEWGECWLEPAVMPPHLEAEILKATGGRVMAWCTRLAPVPWVLRGFAASIEARLAHMPLHLWDLIHFAVSQDNSCRYCYGATRTILKVLGYKEEMIDRIERDAQLGELSQLDQAALRYARKVCKANPKPTPAEHRALMDAGMSRPAIAEVAASGALASYSNRMSTMFALPPESIEHMLDNPIVRLARPLLARKFKIRRQPPFALPEPNQGFMSDLVAALDGTSFAAVVRTIVDESMASPVLARRSKLLIIAVIGHALACEYVEEEARRELQAEGLGSGEITQILTNLGSERLDRRDSLLVPYARETVSYRAIDIQRRTRELARELSTTEVIEAAGVAAAANSLARLSVLLNA